MRRNAGVCGMDSISKERGMGAASAAMAILLYAVVPLRAADFPIYGDRYDIDLLHQMNESGKHMVGVTGTYSGTAWLQWGKTTNLLNLTTYTWGLVGMNDSDDWARASFTLPKVYRINQISIENGVGWAPSGYFEIRSSTDGITWITNTARKAFTASPAASNLYDHAEFFSPTDAKYVDLTVSGPSSSGPGQIILDSFHVYAATNTGEPPQKDAGYSIHGISTVDSGSGWDNNMNRIRDFRPSQWINPTTNTCWLILDLGSVYRLRMFRPTFYGNDDGTASWPTSSLAISLNKTNWTTIYGPGPLGTTNMMFTPENARYVMLTNTYYGGGNRFINELAIFASPPLQGTVIFVK